VLTARTGFAGACAARSTFARSSGGGAVALA
jgi:hypothetical protein